MFESLSVCEADFLKQGINRNLRIDGRTRLAFRDMGFDLNPLQNTFGSCRLMLGQGSQVTDLLVGVRVDLGKPTAAAARGCNNATGTSELFSSYVECNVECSQSALESIDPSLNPSEMANDLSQWLTRILSIPGVLPLNSPDLVISSSKCWVICIDVMILGFCGNLYDSVLLATRSALSKTRIPRIVRADKDDDIEVSDDYENWDWLNTENVPVSITFNKIGLFYLVDASLQEEIISEARINVVLNSRGVVLSIHKSSNGSIPASILIDMVQASSRLGQDLFSALKKYQEIEREKEEADDSLLKPNSLLSLLIN